MKPRSIAPEPDAHGESEAMRGRPFSRSWCHYENDADLDIGLECCAGGAAALEDVVTPSTFRAVQRAPTSQANGYYARLDRIAEMIGALRLIETDLRTLNSRPDARDAHPLRIGRAHALALIDVLGDVAAHMG